MPEPTADPPISPPETNRVWGGEMPQLSAADWVRLGLFYLFLLALGLLAVGAARDIETIVVLGPFSMLLGGAAAGFPVRGSLMLRRLAITAPVFGLAVFVVIFRMLWNPGQAQAPIGAAILLYLWLVVPLGLYWVARACLTTQELARPFQFGLRSLLAVMSLTAVFAGVMRWGDFQGQFGNMPDSVRILFPIAIGSAAILLAGGGLATGCIVFGRRKTLQAPPAARKSFSPD